MVCGKCGNEKKQNCCLCPCAFGVAMGIVSAVFTAILAWIAWCYGVGTGLIAAYGELYYGLAPTFMGGIWGAIWGLVVGFIFGYLLIFVYNMILCCCKGKACHRKDE